MTCNEVARFLMDYLDGELAGAARRAFETHLHQCPECVRYIESYQATIKLGKDAVAAEDSDSDAPEELIRAILAARKERR